MTVCVCVYGLWSECLSGRQPGEVEEVFLADRMTNKKRFRRSCELWELPLYVCGWPRNRRLSWLSPCLTVIAIHVASRHPVRRTDGTPSHCLPPCPAAAAAAEGRFVVVGWFVPLCLELTVLGFSSTVFPPLLTSSATRALSCQSYRGPSSPICAVWMRLSRLLSGPCPRTDPIWLGRICFSASCCLKPGPRRRISRQPQASRWEASTRFLPGHRRRSCCSMLWVEAGVAACRRADREAVLQRWRARARTVSS